jgi:TonB family protein
MHKTYIFLQSLFLITLLVVSTNTVAQSDTTYLDEYNVKCAVSDAKYYRVFKKVTEGYYQQNEYHLSTNALNLSGFCYRIDSPKLQGHCIYYTENGKMSSQGNYKDGLMDGYWASYYEDTNIIWFTTTYEEGTPVGKLESYYLSGKLKRVQTYKKKSGKATGKCFDEAGQKIPFTPFEIMPVAGYSIPSYLKKTMTYPDNSRNHNIEGRIIIRFKIDTTGAIKEAKVVKSLSPETDAEALKAVVSMPPWQPGIQDDKKVEVFFHLPIVYKLD